MSGDADRLHRASYFQERMLHLAFDGLDEDVCVVAWRVRGSLDRGRCQQAVEALVERHETLRTALVDDAGHAVQRVRAEVTLPVTTVRGAAVRGRDPIGRLAREEGERPVLLGAECLASLAMLELGIREHVLVWRFSHAIWDGFCAHVLARDFSALYAGDPPLAPLPVQFGEMVDRDRASLIDLSSGNGGIARREDSPQMAYQGRKLAAGTVSGADVRSLAAVARSERCSLGMLLLAAFCVGLSLESGRDRHVIGLMDANRDRPGADQLIGCVVDVLLVTVALPPDATLRSAVQVVRDAVHTAYDDRLPLERRLHDCGTHAQQRGEENAADALFNFQPPEVRRHRAPVRSDGIELEWLPYVPIERPVRARASWPGSDLGLAALASADGALDLWLAYDSERSTQDATLSLAVSLHQVIAVMTMDLERTLNRLS